MEGKFTWQTEQFHRTHAVAHYIARRPGINKAMGRLYLSGYAQYEINIF